jgi:hypothetical protein
MYLLKVCNVKKKHDFQCMDLNYGLDDEKHGLIGQGGFCLFAG